MQEKLIQYEAVEIIQTTEGKIIKRIFSGRSQDEVRLLALLTMKKGEFVVLFGLRIEDRVHVFLACSDTLGLDMRELVPIVSPVIEGRGGGRASLVEISGQKKENLEKALDKAYQHISLRL